MCSVFKHNEPDYSCEINTSQTLQTRRLRQNWDFNQMIKADFTNRKRKAVFKNVYDSMSDVAFISNFTYLSCHFIT